MKKVEKIMKKLKEIRPVIESKYSAKNIEVFGSYIHAKQKKKQQLRYSCGIFEDHRFVQIHGT
jgi:predicted nucleotidyltransferase